MFEKLRKCAIKRLLKDRDGYTFTGFREGHPIKFFYKEDTNEYLLGAYCGNFYYARPGLSGWCYGMSKYLDWGKDKPLGVEPQEIEFDAWIHGILENIHEQYMAKRKSA